MSADTAQFHGFHMKQPLKRRYVVIDKDKERYPVQVEPEYPNYNYNPRPWNEGDLCPCLSGEAWYFFRNPDDCCSSKVLNNRLPVRLNDTADARIKAWGIYIEQRPSIIPIFCPVIVITLLGLIATVWFIPQWLGNHPDDLQNSTVPLIVFFTVAGFFLQSLVSLFIFRWSL